MTSTHDDLASIQAQLEAALEERITDLMGQIKAVQEVTAQIASATMDIRRQETLREQLEEELGSLLTESIELEQSNEERQARLDKLKEHVAKMRDLRAELMSGLAELAGE